MHRFVDAIAIVDETSAQPHFVFMQVADRFVVIPERVGSSGRIVLMIGRIESVVFAHQVAELIVGRRILVLHVVIVVGLLQQSLEVIDELLDVAGSLLGGAPALGVVGERDKPRGRFGADQAAVKVRKDAIRAWRRGSS